LFTLLYEPSSGNEFGANEYHTKGGDSAASAGSVSTGWDIANGEDLVPSAIGR
jgi:hypothetical protein